MPMLAHTVATLETVQRDGFAVIEAVIMAHALHRVFTAIAGSAGEPKPWIKPITKRPNTPVRGWRIA